MSTSDPNSGGSGARLEEILARGGGNGRFVRYRGWLVLLLVAVLAVVAYRFLGDGGGSDESRYITEPVTTGTLVVRISATGNLQPTNQVDVGSELSGIVEEVFVDENAQVTRGQILARLDLSKLEDAVARSRANLAAAEAQVQQAQATVAESRASLERLRNVSRMSAGKVPSQNEMDAAEANFKRAEANVASARASVTQARAALQSDQTNIDKAHIRSPIDGIVLTRQVEPGQTVAASFQAPVLFTLAEDLTRMELQVDVDEADVGQVKVGQQAVFSVDAWPGREYRAVITQVAYGSQVKEGVVSYPATLEVHNSDLSLRPGMTATAEITTLTREDVLLVPNAALRFTPPAAAVEDQRSGGGILRAIMPRPPRSARRQQSADAGATGARQVWVLRDGEALPVDVQTGASNGRVTEISGGDISTGTRVITEVVSGPS